MSLLNYIYISKRKLGIYYPQIYPTQDVTTKLSVSLGILKGEVATKSPKLTEHERLQKIVRHLVNQGSVGTIEDPKAFFAGTLSAKSLMHGRMVFFGGKNELGEQKHKYVGLTCSLEHMLGDYDLKSYHQEHLGPTRSEHFMPASHSLGFARTLRTIWSKDDFFEKAQFNAEEERALRLQEHRLTQEEQNMVKKKQALNRLLLYVHPEGLAHMWRSIVLETVCDPILVRIFGKDKYQQKLQALHKLEHSRQVNVEKILSSEDLELLHAIMSATRNIEAPSQHYEFFALKLIQGKVDKNEVLLGSPLYMALVY